MEELKAKHGRGSALSVSLDTPWRRLLQPSSCHCSIDWWQMIKSEGTQQFQDPDIPWGISDVGWWTRVFKLYLVDWTSASCGWAEVKKTFYPFHWTQRYCTQSKQNPLCFDSVPNAKRKLFAMFISFCTSLLGETENVQNVFWMFIKSSECTVNVILMWRLPSIR